MKHIMFCSKCEIYTMKELCPNCSEKTILKRPPKFSLNDKYASYKREVKKEDLIKKGLY